MRRGLKLGAEGGLGEIGARGRSRPRREIDDQRMQGGEHPLTRRLSQRYKSDPR